jgi:fused signal recognition particle receptor
VKKGLWRTIMDVALTDVSVLVKGLDENQIERLEQVLIEADFGPAALDVIEELEVDIRRGKLKTEDAMRAWLVEKVMDAINGSPHESSDPVLPVSGLNVILMLGVNGVGKTTQAAKLAFLLQGQGKTVLFAAADTYRAGASEQLQVWADRLNAPCITGSKGGDPAAVAFDAIESASARQMDAVLIDTAGRLHTHSDLMEELRKIVRVVSRRVEGAPHQAYLVLDGTVGQNAIQQGRLFAEAVPLTGLILSKMDGTAKGGAVIPITRELNIPIRFLGVGENLPDLEPFNARKFADQLVGF